MALQIGDLLSQRYRIGQILTQGGGHPLYRAHDQVSGKDVLIKEIASPGNLGDVSDTIQTGTLRGLQHTNLIPFTDQVTIPGQGSYMVFDSAGGESPRLRLEKNGTMPYTEAIPLVLNLCDVIYYLHNYEPPLAHGAIGLESIFINPDGKVTLLYTGDQVNPSTESEKTADVRSLGKTAYTLLTGLPPPEDAEGNNLAQIETQLQENFPRIPTTISAVIARCVDPALEKGFTTIEDFKAALLYALVQIPPETLRTTPINLQPGGPTGSEGFNPVILPETETQPPQAATPPEPTTPIRRRVPWGFL